ncbi:MAG: NACHT and WD repeat domain-containing protein [Cyanobacteria bacterium P01_D01_bin.56]
MEFNFEDVLAYVNDCIQTYGPRSLTGVEEAILRCTWDGLSYSQMARQMTRANMAYTPNTLQKEIGFKLWRFLSEVWSDEVKVTKPKFREIAERRYRQYRGLLQESTMSSIAQSTATPSAESLGSVRSQPLLDKLRSRNSPLTVLTGASGIGKSHLLQTIESELNELFIQVIRHSVYEPLDWSTWHQKLCISKPNSDGVAPTLSEHQIRHQVVRTLNQDPYLIIIEQGERFLADPTCYSFLQEVTTLISPKSCFLWVTAIQPTLDNPIPTEKITGLSFIDTKVFLQEQYPYLSGFLSQQEVSWQYLNKLCGGNPSLLHKSVDTLKSFYANHIEDFIANLLPLSPSLNSYFEQIFVTLSEPERALLYWLVFCPLSWPQIREWTLVLPFTQTQLIQAWDKLHRKHFLEFYSETEGLCQLAVGYFRLYLLQILQTTFIQELIDENLYLFHRYPLNISHTPPERQRELNQYLLKPVATALQKNLPSDALLEKFERLLGQLSTFPQRAHSCAAGNLFNLAAYLELALPEDSWTGLTLWYANLSSSQSYDFHRCCFNNTELITGFQGATVSALHPQGHAVAIGDEQGWLQIYRQNNHRFSLGWCQDLGVPISDICITNDERLIVTLMDQTIHIWDDLTINEQSYDALSSEAPIRSLSLRSDSNLMAAGVSSGQVYTWNLMWGDTNGEPLPEITDIVRHLAFSPDGSMLAGHVSDNRVQIWYQDPMIDTYAVQKAPLPLNRYGHFLAFAWLDAELQIVEAVADETVPDPYLKVMVRSFTLTEEFLAEDSVAPHMQTLNSAYQPHKAAFSDNGLYFALCDMNHKVYLWYRLSPKIEKTIVLPTLPYCLSISNDGNRLLCQNTDTVSLWDLEHQHCIKVWETVSDLDQYRGYKFYRGQGLSNDELIAIERLEGIVC